MRVDCSVEFTRNVLWSQCTRTGSALGLQLALPSSYFRQLSGNNRRKNHHRKLTVKSDLKSSEITYFIVLQKIFPIVAAVWCVDLCTIKLV